LRPASSVARLSKSQSRRIATSATLSVNRERQRFHAVARSPTIRAPSKREEIMPEEFWLRVHEDGCEERYDHDPAPIRALRVVVTDGFEPVMG
jgi:hypothetical protein